MKYRIIFHRFIARNWPYRYNKKKLFLLQDRGSNIPQGDQEKCNYSRTTQQDSFCTPGLRDFQPFDRESAVKSLRKTTFQLGDRRIPEYLGTTAGDSYPSRLMTGSARCSDHS